jgi:hypothetical protein
MFIHNNAAMDVDFVLVKSLVEDTKLSEQIFVIFYLYK